MKNIIGSQIKNIRNNNKLSQTRFGFKIGLTGKTISAYETGKCTPPLKILDRIAETYKVTFTHTYKNNVGEKIALLEQHIKELKSLIIDIN